MDEAATLASGGWAAAASGSSIGKAGSVRAPTRQGPKA
jgi:hypothetical protein